MCVYNFAQASSTRVASSYHPIDSLCDCFLLQNTWLFEVNPSAKWFYDWEVGAARDRRAMTHVFEVYVFYERTPPNEQRIPPSPSSTAAAPPNRGTFSLGSESSTGFANLEVVALVESSPFTLISFRRAPTPSPGSTAASTMHPKQLSLEATEESPRSRAARSSTARGPQHDGDADDDGNDEAEHDFLLESRLWRLDAKTSSGGSNEEVEMSDPLSPVATAAKNMILVAWFLLHIPMVATLPFVSALGYHLYANLRSHLGPSHSSSLAAALALNGINIEDLVSRLLTSARSPPFGTAIGSDALHATEATRDATKELIVASVNLAVWMLFDKENCEQIESFLQRSSKVLLDKVALNQSYQAFVEWLQERIDEHLSASGWSLARLVAQIKAYSHAAESNIDWQQLDALLSSDDRAILEAGHARFIAQVRELYLSARPLSHFARFAQMRIHPNPFELRSPAIASSVTVGLSRYSGLWLCDVGTVSVHRLQTWRTQASQDGKREESPVLMTLLWFWKQLGCLRLAISNENDVPSLLIASVFTPALAGDRLTRIVLDRKHHWFRCLPCGESTIGVHLGGQMFGDYVASINPS